MFSARLGFMRPDRVDTDLPPVVDSAQLIGYFDAGIYDSMDIDNGLVSKWHDRSGNNWYLSNVTGQAVNSPTYITVPGPVKNIPAIKFNSNNNTILGQTVGSTTGNIPQDLKMFTDDPHTILYVDSHPGAQTDKHEITWMLGGSGKPLNATTPTPDGRTADFSYEMGSSNSTTPDYRKTRTPARIAEGEVAILWGDRFYEMPRDRFVLQFSTWSGSVAEFITDGGAGQNTVTTTGSYYNQNPSNQISLDRGRNDYKDNFVVGGRQYYKDYSLQSGSQYSNTAVNKILIFRGQISESDRQIIEGWAAHDTGIAEHLPDDHPYKSAPPGVI